MLQIETVAPNTLSILKSIMEIPELKEFSLVGGTALSLNYGHRRSDDLDLFSNANFENAKIIDAFNKKFKKLFTYRSSTPHFGIFSFVDNVKIDIIHHPYPLIGDIRVFDGIRMFSLEDIAAMKIQAVLGRGKKKDFWDIAELLQHFSIDDLIKFHKEKYKEQNLLITVPQALTYFADADESEDPISLKKQTWGKIQRIIQKKVSDYLQ